MLNRTIGSPETPHDDDIQRIVQSEKWFTVSEAASFSFAERIYDAHVCFFGVVLSFAFSSTPSLTVLFFFAFQEPLIVLVFGASGDLAKKKTYPALYDLWQRGLLPPQTLIWGFARTKWTTQQLRVHLRSYVAPSDRINPFLDLCFYRHGKEYGDMLAISSILQCCNKIHNLLVYLAIPPQVFTDATLALKQVLSRNGVPGFVRVVVEKPFGHDTTSCRKLLDSLKEQQWKESELYRIDHYLGKEMVQNILMLRYYNSWLQHIWNKDVIQSVHILFKEPFGTEGRGGYFDSIGIVRDICQVREIATTQVGGLKWITN